MKRNTQPIIVISICLFWQILQANAQLPVYQIQGPHTEYEGPYYIRTFINFVQTPADPWTTSVNLSNRANGILAKLNAVYNQHNIYFIGEDFSCNPGFDVITETNFSPSHIHETALDIFDLGDEGSPGGVAYGVPNTYCEVTGSDSLGPASQSEIIIHEVGHCLGLSHTFTGMDIGECLETVSGCQNNDHACYCCGDYVCDTPISQQTITINSDCSQSISPSGLAPEAFRNFMSYATPGRCRDLFTHGQVRRMWAYLALDSNLQYIQLQEVTYPGATPSGVCGNIIVETGHLVIDSPIEMLPGATIRVKKGARLTVTSTITGACGQLWQGIIVEGTTFAAQTDSNQGRITLTGTGKLEHARVAIEVQDTDPNGSPVNNSGGGIVWVTAGALHNNCIGIRYGPYVALSNGKAASNRSVLVGPDFLITDDYRGGNIQPKCMELDGVVRLKVLLGAFSDQRGQCTEPASRAIGIDAKDAGLIVSSGEFDGLDIGIRVDQLNELAGSFTLTGSEFTACFKGVLSLSTSGFSISGNDFIVKRPDNCPPDSSGQIIGAQIRGNTTGFHFSGNDFSFDGTDSLPERLIGSDCQNLKEGLGNTIRKNSYLNLNFGNRAFGINSGLIDGLLYLCSTNSNKLSLSSDFRIDSAGSIKSVQADFGPLGQTLPTGNIFSDLWYSFENRGAPVDYYFDDTDPLQRPSAGAEGSIGIIERPQQDSNPNCDDPEPCSPCPPDTLEVWKEQFLQNQESWLNKKAALPGITDPNEREAEEAAIGDLRLAMNRVGGRILRNYGQDTVEVEVDSIVAWLGHLQTYQTDLRLARHYFFAGNYAAFDALWQNIPTEYDLDETNEAEFDRLGELFGEVGVLLQSGSDLNRLPAETIEYLKDMTGVCDEAGYLCEAILWRNGVRAGPECEAVSDREESPGQGKKIKVVTGNPLIYPNPCNDVLLLEHAWNVPAGLFRLYNLYGQVAYEASLFPRVRLNKFDVSGLAPGVYFAGIQWSNSTRLEWQKIIVAC